MVEKRALMVIDGELRRGGGQEFPVHNPATGEIIGTARDATMAEIKEACEVAQKAWPYWAHTTEVQAKEKIFENLRNALQNDRYPIAWQMAQESGKTFEECVWDVNEAIDTYQHYSHVATDTTGKINVAQLKNKVRYTIRLPYGVVACSIPFNFPLGIFSWKTGGAIAGGNAIVLKDAEQTPFSAEWGSQLFLESMEKELGSTGHFKRVRGILNLLHGRGDVGDCTGVNLVEKGNYDLFVFTGGVATGSKIGEICGRRLKPFHPELGGHARMIILSEYIKRRGLDKAVGEVIRGCMGTNAQRCVTTRGGFVEKDVFWSTAKRHMEMAHTWKIGDACDPHTKFGPLIDEAAVQNCENAVAELSKRGYYPLIGGYRLGPETITLAKEKDHFSFDPDDFKKGGRLAKGNFFVPTLYVNIPSDARPVQEEIFGPIFFYNEIPEIRPSALSEFSSYLLREHLELRPDTEEFERMARFLYAIELVNNSEYGLSNAVLTTDLTEAWLAANLIRSGITYIGRGTTGAEVPGKFGGIKNSGWNRDGEGIDDYTYEKTIWIDMHPTVRMAQTGSFKELENWVRENGKLEELKSVVTPDESSPQALHSEQIAALNT